jgi:multidrug efflux pump subunit AcrA (membrane-fusion protein)
MSKDPNDIHDKESADISFEEEMQRARRARVVRQRNIVLVTIALLTIVVIAFLIWRWKKSAKENEAEVTPTVGVKVVKAEKGPIATEISAIGTIWPREKADVAAKVSAQIKQMSLLKNKLVRAGEVIAVLESRDLQAQRAEAAAALNEARANERSLVSGTIPKTNAEDQKALLDAHAKVNNTRATYERRRALYANGGISKKDLEAAQLELTTAEDELRL